MEGFESHVAVMTPIRGTDIAGFHVLTDKGELGVHDAGGEFHVDAMLTTAFQQHNRGFIQRYVSAPSDAARLAIVFGATDRKPHDPLLMLFEESVIRQLYPVGGPVNQGLTAFQKKNRQKNATQGLQLLLNYHRDPGTTAMTFCPVLFDRHTSLSAYAERFGRAVTDADATIPVLEVVNLLEALPPDLRMTSEALALRERIAQGVAQEVEPRATMSIGAQPEHWEPDAAGVVAFTDIDRDKHHQRNIDFSPAHFAQLHKTQRFEQVERWLETPYRPVDIGSLRRFVQFRNLDDLALATLASGMYIYTAPSGARLLERGQADAWNMYLLQGVVSLEAGDGEAHFVEGETGKAVFPVAFLKPRKYAVIAVTPVSFLWVHDEMLQSLAQRRVDEKTRLGLAGR